jgi:hypothetical protein
MGTDWKGKFGSAMLMGAGLVKLIWPGHDLAVDNIVDGIIGSVDGIALILVGWTAWAIRQAVGPSKAVKK